MDVMRGIVGNTDSEFTGVKGRVLRYAGTVYALLIASQFVRAFAAHDAALNVPLNVLAATIALLGLVAYPVGSALMKRGRTA